MPEEAPPVTPPAATPVSEPHGVQALSQSQTTRIEEPERPAERTDRLPPLELPPQSCKVPLQVPISNSMLENPSHISSAHTGLICSLAAKNVFSYSKVINE